MGVIKMSEFKERREIITEWIEEKLNWIDLKSLNLTEFFIAGGALRPNEKINDFDLYPVRKGDFKKLRARNTFLSKPPFGKTINSDTYFLNGYLVQLSKSMGGSIREVIDTFDFAHVKMGARVKLVEGKYKVEDIYFSEDYKRYLRTGKNEYCRGKAHPIDSLLRTYKYAERGLLQPKDVVYDIIETFLSRYKQQVESGVSVYKIGEKDKKLMST